MREGFAAQRFAAHCACVRGRGTSAASLDTDVNRRRFTSHSDTPKRRRENPPVSTGTAQPVIRSQPPSNLLVPVRGHEQHVRCGPGGHPDHHEPHEHLCPALAAIRHPLGPKSRLESTWLREARLLPNPTKAHAIDWKRSTMCGTALPSLLLQRVSSCPTYLTR